MRRSLLIVLVGAATLLILGIVTGVAGHRDAVTQQREALAHSSVEQARDLENYLARARTIVLLTAQNPVFADFYSLPGSRAERIRAGGRVLDRVNAALGYLEQLYPESIGEACFIDRSGAENARMVRGVRASVKDLSPDESKNPFFRPTLALAANQVHHARPYVSPDTDEWVLANASPVPSRSGTAPGFVHYEVTIESFRREAAAGAAFPTLVVDADTGKVIIDTRHPQSVGSPLGAPTDSRFESIVHGWGTAGTLQLGVSQAAYQLINSSPGNANRWYAVAITPEAVGTFGGVSVLAFGLIAVGLLLLVYVVVGFRSGHSMLVSEANTDVLTGLHNRRRLVADLGHELAKANEGAPLVFMLCDLNGFKAYNDAFGHPAGDALLARLGVALKRAIAGRGQAYRIGGDEFCVLARIGTDGADATVAAAAAALSEQGEGFHITASHGTALLPHEASDPEEALRLVDQRMYAQKHNTRIPADQQTRYALLRALHERHPDLAGRLDRVADLAQSVCQRLGVDGPERERIGHAAQMHDIGKMGIPDAILNKAGPLDPSEWAFIRHSPLIGERIAAAAPALTAVARIIRSTRERFDGSGYPDRLAGEAIPLGARIIAACHAYVAMTAHRSYAPTLTRAEAIDELHRSAGTQLDPQIVAVLVDLLLAPSVSVLAGTDAH
jgi:diguanylate cyclase (GGDEF)-like protein